MNRLSPLALAAAMIATSVSVLASSQVQAATDRAAGAHPRHAIHGKTIQPASR